MPGTTAERRSITRNLSRTGRMNHYECMVCGYTYDTAYEALVHRYSSESLTGLCPDDWAFCPDCGAEKNPEYEGAGMIRIKRIYDKPDDGDGVRILVERLWPRGMKKERAKIDLWMHDLGASTELRRWFGHDPEKWEEFQEKYFLELSNRPKVIRELIDLIREKPAVTFLYAAHDEEHNNAVALKKYLELNAREP